jgi:heat shock protein HtpX
MAGFVVFLVFISYVAGEMLGYGSSFVWTGVLFSLASCFGSYYFGDQIVIAMSGARKADRKKEFDFFTVCENIAIAAGIPKPSLYVIDDSAMNAFATGRDPQHAVVCATRGILERLDRRELEAVVAHEISHIRYYDIRLMAVVAVLAGTIAFVSDMFMRSLWFGGNRRSRDRDDSNGIFIIFGVVLMIASPFIATIIQLAISRNREFLADAGSAELTRNPDALVRALQKISKDSEVLEAASNATAHLYIANPFKGKSSHAWFASLFDTHPPIEERIRALRKM